MGVNNDNPCPMCGSVYSDYEGDSYFRCRECQNLYNNAIGKWAMYGKVKITYSNGTGSKPEPEQDERFDPEFIEIIARRVRNTCTEMGEKSLPDGLVFILPIYDHEDQPSALLGHPVLYTSETSDVLLGLSPGTDYRWCKYWRDSDA